MSEEVFTAAGGGTGAAPDTSAWQQVVRPVLSQLSDLFGARLNAGPISEVRGGWRDLQPHVPATITAVVAALGGGLQGEIGLVWAVADSGAMEQWTDSPEAQAGLWETVEPGISAGLSEAVGAPVTLATDMEPQTGPADMLESEGEQAILIRLDAAGDGISFFLGLVVSELIAAEVCGNKTYQPAPPMAAPPPAAEGEWQSRPPHLQQLRPGPPPAAGRELDVVLDLPLHLTVEVGKARVLLKDVLALGKGSVVGLDRLAGDLVDIFVNGKMIAKGEIVVLPDGNFGVRVVDVASSKDRLRNLQAE